MIKTLTATDRDSGKRVDIWLHGKLPRLSRSRIRSLIESGQVTVAGKHLTPHTRVAAGMQAKVHVPPPRKTDLVAQDIPLNIIHEDSSIIVVNKRDGMVVHPAAGHDSGTLVNALLHHCRDLAGVGGELRPGIVHRLDKDTSGVMVAAKNERAMERLAAGFKLGEVRKDYTALVHGIPDPKAGTIETLVGRSRHDRKKMSTHPASGRVAVTHYEVTQVFLSSCLVHARIETGRTHQIRVHMAHIGHPVVGDRQYCAPKRERLSGVTAPRQMLHATRLAFSHPETGRQVDFEAPLPDDMAELLSALRAES